jgi:GDPmannose 4,6-dehydratase
MTQNPDSPRAQSLLSLVPQVKLLKGDVTNFESICRALEVASPNEVYNLAAMSFVAQSWQLANLTTEVTAKGTLNMLEACKQFAGNDIQSVKYYQASSSEMFGATTASPQDETTAFWPRSPYGVAKVFSHHMTINYRESYGMHASSGILFNHESPRRPEQFVSRKITKAAARISLGLQDKLTLGNLDTRRDWGFAGDYVVAMWKMLQAETAGDYVIATGKSHSLREFVTIAFNAVGITEWEKYVEIDPSFIRPADIQVLVGNPTKAMSQLGWEPTYSFERLINEMVAADLVREDN